MGDQLISAGWHKSSFSNAGGNCIEVAVLSDGGVAVRDSKNRAAGSVSFSRAAMSVWLAGVKAGAFASAA
jgi:hypothetical protein